MRIDRDLLERYGTAVPRYTSYPTAVDWSDQVDSRTYRSLLEAAAGRPGDLSAYVHVPFCRQRCLYCGCNVVITRSRERVGRYVESLLAEIANVARTGIGGRTVRQLSWGGGTPNHLEEDQIERIHGALLDAFRLAEGAELSIELDPRVTTPGQLERLASLGFDRVSLGVQDFTPEVQRDIRREQSEEETRAVVATARELGFRSVNVDLIYGLPYQRLSTFEETARAVLALRPERVALFHYAHVPWIKKHQAAMTLAAIPSRDEKLAIFLRALELFEEAGYAHIGLDHFALPEDELHRAAREGTLRRNFMGYTTTGGEDTLGFGTSAIGEVAGAYVQNDATEEGWRWRVDESGLGAARGHALSRDDELRRDVIGSLMCNGVVFKHDVETRHGIAFEGVFAVEMADLEPLAADGLVELEQGSLRLTPLGRLFSRNVAAVFDRYFRERRRSGAGAERTYSKSV